MTAWWERESYRDGDLLSVGFIQFDLSGHSAWVSKAESQSNRNEIYQSRALLQEELRRAVAGYDFDMHHWAGDGGLFAGRVANVAQADNQYKAMSQMYSAFDAWRKESPLRQGLHCRISGTVIPQLCIDQKPGNWFSSDLNWFLKYERQIGREGTIRITKSLRDLLSTCSGNFPIPESQKFVSLPDGSTVAIFQDKTREPPQAASGRSFREWLSRRRGELRVSNPTVTIHNLPENIHQFGDAVLLNSALGETGYRELYLERRATSQVRSEVFKTSDDRAEWLRIKGDLAASGVVGTKCRVHTLKPELLDDPALRLEWSLGAYSEANAFSGVVLGAPLIAQRYSDAALKVLQEGTNIPNTLSNHSIVVLGDGSKRELLFAHRRKGTRPGTYSRNCWSVSFEEQMNPIEEDIGGRILHADATVEDCIRRGLREEFLTPSCSDPTHVAIHAFQLEAACINFGFLAVVQLPRTSFEDLMALWPEAVDSPEHDAIAAMPLDPGLIEECLAAERFPQSVFGRLKRSVGFEALELTDHKWHPTSTMRLLLALWQAETL